MSLAIDFQPCRPVVLLHAFPLNRRMWGPQLGVLRQAGFSPVAPDLPGFGDSPLSGPPDLEHFARAVLRTLDQLHIERAAWVGLSMGGYVLFRVLALAPERVAAVVLADTRAEPDSPEARARRFDQASRVAASGPQAIAEGFLEGALGPTSRRQRPGVVGRVRELVLQARPAGIIHALHAMAARPDSTPLLGSIRVPALAMVGQEDALTPPAVVKALAERIPGARCVEIPGAGHLPNLETPEAFNEALLNFLRETWRG